MGIKILLSYRRGDSAEMVEALYAELAVEFDDANVFKDTHDIPVAGSVSQHIDDAISAADVVLLMIGEEWHEAGDINDPFDWVRIEIETAIRKHRTVIPMVMNSAKLPTGQSLPESIRGLLDTNGSRLAEETWRSDVDRLVSALKRIESGETITGVRRRLSAEDALHARGSNTQVAQLSHAYEGALKHAMANQSFEDDEWLTVFAGAVADSTHPRIAVSDLPDAVSGLYAAALNVETSEAGARELLQRLRSALAGVDSPETRALAKALSGRGF